MARKYAHAIAITAIALLPTISSAQGTMDIGLFHNNGNLEVKVRPTSGFDGVFSSVVFTLRWERATDLSLGEAVTPEGTPINTRRSGTMHEDGMFNYLVFAGFGFDNMAESGLQWANGQEYTILTIPVEGKGVVELVNDEWTGVPTNNADFYVSLGGHDKTGVIYKRMAATTDLEGTVQIKPNPNEGLFQFSFVSTDAVDLRVDVVNTLGQSSFTQTLRGFEGTYVKDMDLTHMSEGIYYLKISRGEKTSVHKIVYQ